MTERRLEFDRRVYARHVLLLEGRVCKVGDPAGAHRITMSNISLHGMMLHSDKKHGATIYLGDILQLEFVAPFAGRLVSFDVLVEWKFRTPHNILGQWSFGASFVESRGPHVTHLYEPVARLWNGIPDMGE